MSRGFDLIVREYNERYKMLIERELKKCKRGTERDLKKEELQTELHKIDDDVKIIFSDVVHRLVYDINTRLVNGVCKFSKECSGFVLRLLYESQIGEDNSSYTVRYTCSGLDLEYNFVRVHEYVCFEMAVYAVTGSDSKEVSRNPHNERFVFQCNGETAADAAVAAAAGASYNGYKLSECIPLMSKQIVLYNALLSIDSDDWKLIWVGYAVYIDMGFKRFHERLHVVVRISDEEGVLSEVVFREWYLFKATDTDNLFGGSVTLLHDKICNEKEFIDYINALCGSKPPSTSGQPPTHAQLLDFERRIDALRLI